LYETRPPLPPDRCRFFILWLGQDKEGKGDKRTREENRTESCSVKLTSKSRNALFFVLTLPCLLVYLSSLSYLNPNLKKPTLMSPLPLPNPRRSTGTSLQPRHPTPHTPHPTPDTPHPTPDTRHPTPDTPHPTPDTPHPTPDTPHPTPHTRHPTPDTPHPTPHTPHPSPNS
jgi:cytoskeletal protein RodZ